MLSFSRLLAVVMMVSTVASFGADSESGSSDEITIRLKLGGTIFSGLDPVAGGVAGGADIQLGVAERFSIGAHFVSGNGSRYVTGTDTESQLTSFTVSGLYTIRRGSLAASIGPMIGALSASTSVNSGPSVSDTRFALGAGAFIDMPVWGSLFVNVSAQFLYSLGSGTNFGGTSVLGGLGLRF